MALHVITPRGGHRDASQGEKLVQVVAAEPELHVDGAEFDQAGDMTIGLNARLANGGVDVESIGRVLIAQRQYRVAPALGQQRQAFEFPFGVEAHPGVLLATSGRGDGREFGTDAGFAGHIVKTNGALVERQTVDQHVGIVVLLVLVKQPAFAPVGTHFQSHRRLHQVDI